MFAVVSNGNFVYHDGRCISMALLNSDGVFLSSKFEDNSREMMLSVVEASIYFEEL